MHFEATKIKLQHVIFAKNKFFSSKGQISPRIRFWHLFDTEMLEKNDFGHVFYLQKCKKNMKNQAF